jgi:hypothetical protein
MNVATKYPNVRSWIRILCSLGGVLFLAIFGHAQLPLNDSQPGYFMDPIGGQGGGQFIGRCFVGTLLAGFELRAGDDVDAIRPVCVAAYGPRETSLLSLTSGSGLEQVGDGYGNVKLVFGWYGGTGGSIKRVLCPTEQPIVTGMEVRAEGVDTVVVNNIHLFCGLAATNQNPSEFPSAVFDAPAYSPSRGFLGHGDSAHTAGGTQRCPTGQVAVGVHGRSGIWLDAIGLICGEPKLLNRSGFNGGFASGVKPGPVKLPGRIKLPLAPLLYAITNNDHLVWYKHLGFADGSRLWEGPYEVGSDWSNYKQVIPGGEGIIYVVNQNDKLLWCREMDYNHGAKAWEGPREVGSDWGNFKQVFSAGKGILYAITQDDRLLWYHELDYIHGVKAWEGPKEMGGSWGNFKQVFSGGEGIVYAITQEGKLLWYKHRDYLHGAKIWEGPLEVGSDWGNFKQVFSGGGGIVYALTQDDHLLWYKEVDYLNGIKNWEGPKDVGSDWTNLTRVFGQL